MKTFKNFKKTLMENKEKPFFGAPRKESYTNKHRPLVWEGILGEVNALKHGDEEAKHFGYNYENAHNHAGTESHDDLRVCKVKHSYAGWPPKGRLALFGIPK